MNVLLVHGIFDTGAIFRKLERDLTQQGHRCFSPSLHPSDARKGIADLAEKLDVLAVKEFGNEAPIVIVAFSMGCLVARYYVQCLGGARRTKAFFAISGPHNGSLLAHLYPGEGARDMRPGSKFLQELASSEVLFGEMPLFTYWTPLDLTIVPATSSRWSRAIEKIIWVPSIRLCLPMEECALILFKEFTSRKPATSKITMLELKIINYDFCESTDN